MARSYRSTRRRRSDVAAVPPPADLKRWQPRDKAAVVLAVRAGVISRSEAYARYMLSEEELSSWEEAFDRDGIAGLQAKRQRER